MKVNAEEFMNKLNEARRAATEKNNDVIGRIPSERIVPMIDSFFDDLFQMTEKFHVAEQEEFCSSAVRNLAYALEYVADLSASKSYFREERTLNDEDVAIFAQIFIDLEELKKEVYDCYEKGDIPDQKLRDKIRLIGVVIEGGSIYGLCGDHIIVPGFSNIQKLVHYMTKHWDEIEGRCRGKCEGKSGVYDLIFEFKKFRNYEKSYTDDELAELLYGLLNGTKKLSKPVRVYAYRESYSRIIPASYIDDDDKAAVVLIG